MKFSTRERKDFDLVRPFLKEELKLVKKAKTKITYKLVAYLIDPSKEAIEAAKRLGMIKD